MLDQQNFPQCITEEEIKDIEGQIKEMENPENRGSCNQCDCEAGP